MSDKKDTWAEPGPTTSPSKTENARVKDLGEGGHGHRDVRDQEEKKDKEKVSGRPTHQWRKRRCLLELFAGRAGLTTAVQDSATGKAEVVRQLKSYQRLGRPPGVRPTAANPCTRGEQRFKPTAISTNASWVSTTARWCEDTTIPHKHVKLEGKAQDYWGNLVRYTQLAAEYHAEMVEAGAEEFAK